MTEELKRYKILEEIGRGGFAIVYRAEDTELGRQVALKELWPTLLHDAEWVKSLKREARTIARLDHPRIVTIHDVVELDQRLFIVMHLIDGASLEDLIASQAPLPWSQVLEVIRAIAEALDYAHAQGILHRDLKPANVLLDSKRGPLLSDFGLAKLVSEASTNVSVEGGIVGTPHYVAPEVWEGQGTTRQSDIYALGCILYEMLTGRKLFAGESPPAVMRAHFSPVTLPDSWPEDVPAGLTKVLKAALAKQPGERYATAGEMVKALSAPEITGRLRVPAQPTSFIGREQELADIADRLADPACRLLTLIGVGGIGKTRLALQAATECQPAFAEGVYFVPLEPVQAVDFLPFAIADALQFSLVGQERPFNQLCDYLGRRKVLLVLDNFEHLLTDSGISLLANLLAAAPKIKLLVTSREALHLREEWLYTVAGLPFPAPEEPVSPETFAAVALFIERARQARHDFSADQDLTALARICQLVEGMPLALELAAAWAKTLTCAEIAAEIQSGLDFLSTRLRNMPARHRSLQAVFDHTCRQLLEKERAIFVRLSVFCGGFDRAAAAAVAGASLPLLSKLLDISLLRWNPEGRYHMHELLRQYATEHLAESKEALTQVQGLHCAYYAAVLNDQMPNLAGVDQLAAVAAIETDLQNVRAAWQWAVRQTKMAELLKAAKPLALFYQYQSRYAEALNTFEQAAGQVRHQVTQLEPSNLALADILMGLSWFSLRFGRLDEAEGALTQIQAIYDRFQVKRVPGFVTQPAAMLGFVALIRGNYATTVQLAQQALAASDRYPHQSNQEIAYFLLAQVALIEGDYETAQKYAQLSCETCQAVGDRWFMAEALNTLGDVAVARKAYPVARQQYEASYTIRQAFNDAGGMAVALNHLSDIALAQEDYQEAQRLFEQSLALYQRINDTGGLATSYHGLGYSALAQDDYAAARQHFCQALQLAADISYISLILTLLVGLGELLCRLGRPEQGLILFSLVQHHPATNQEIKDRTEALLRRFKRQIQPKVMRAASEQGQKADLASTVKTLLADLPTLDLSMDLSVISSDTDVALTDPNQALIEPLTNRELEVLQCLADGLSNQEIADRLIIATGTVKFYTNQIYGKLQVRNRNRAVVLARELKLL